MQFTKWLFVIEFVLAQGDSTAKNNSNESLGKGLKISDEVLIGICVCLVIGIIAAFFAIICACKKSFTRGNPIVNSYKNRLYHQKW